MLSNILRGLREVCFPQFCGVCLKPNNSGMPYVCTSCRQSVSVLDLHHHSENAMRDRFWGRVSIARATALLPYGKDTPAQRLMWLLKYDNQPQVGMKLGAWLGQNISESQVFGPIDCVLPVPLHPRRLRWRGYNQAAKIASGIAQELGVHHHHNGAQRIAYTETQTRKSHAQRVANVAEVFRLSPKLQLEGQHVLLVDDVMTTGATLESLAGVVSRQQPASIKVATLALAR